MSGLNQHLPFLHLPSLDLNHMDVALLLSICSIGALYCFEKELARKLHEAAAVFLTEVNPFSPIPVPFKFLIVSRSGLIVDS
jgi:hypothetical protein